MAVEEKKSQRHTFYMQDRKELHLSGVLDVRSFDEQEAVLDTEMGILILRGSGLHMGRFTLEKGEIDIDGRVDSFVYTDKKGRGKNGESFFARLLR